MSVITVPSHLTDTAHSVDELKRLHDEHGIEGIWYQVQNGGNNPVNYDLNVARNAGLFSGVWGVTYDQWDQGNNPRHLTPYQQNEILGKQAALLKPDAVMVDAEEFFKNSRGEAKAGTITGYAPGPLGTEMLNGIRAGGWDGPVHLTPIGAPADPLVDDHKFDLEVFLQTDGGIFAQAYAQLHTSYQPAVTKKYYVERLKVPADRYNSMIWLTSSVTAQDWVRLLREAESNRAISVFMTEYGTEADWDILDFITKPIAIPPPVDPRLTLDPNMVPLRDDAILQFKAATAKVPENWVKANPREWQVLQNYMLYRLGFNQPPPQVEGWTRPFDPPSNCGTRIGRGIANSLMASASLVGRFQDEV